MPVSTRPKAGKRRLCQVQFNRSAAERREQKAIWKFTQKYQKFFTDSRNVAEGCGSNHPGRNRADEGRTGTGP